MQKNRWLCTGRCLSLLVTLLIATLSALYVTAAGEHDPGSANLVRDANMSAELPRASLPVGHADPHGAQQRGNSGGVFKRHCRSWQT